VTSLRIALPGVAWVPPTLRSGAYWRTVWRFVLWGPLIGGAPYAMFIFPIPFAHAIGLVPALLAGLLFAVWWHQPSARVPGPRWRLCIGILYGTAASLPAMLVWPSPGGAMLIALHGIPAATILALLQRRSGRAAEKSVICAGAYRRRSAATRGE
jgi:hypothetical protein